MSNADIDRNLLFAVLAFHVDLIDVEQFARACSEWTKEQRSPLAEILIRFGWITPVDKSDVERLMQRRLDRHEGSLKATLAESFSDSLADSLAQIEDKECRDSLVTLASTTKRSIPNFSENFSTSGKRYSRPRAHARGGIGQIWVARDTQLGRDVALKTMLPGKARDESMVSRFLNEAQITGQLEHPGIVPVYELAIHPETQEPFYAMRYVKGRTFHEVVREFHQQRENSAKEFSEATTLLNAFVQVCKTIAYAHSRGVIHRDLKGENVIVGDFGEVVVLDWGLAKLVGVQDVETPSAAVRVSDHEGTPVELTTHGDALGTPGYMAPEQAMGRPDPVDCRTDVYGLGAMLYFLLTGKPPFVGTTVKQVLEKVCNEEPDSPRQVWSDVPPTIEAACLRAIDKNPSDRFASANDLAREVERWQEVQRKEAIEALRASEELYHSLVECSSLNVWRKDLEGRFTFVNKGLCEAFGLEREDLIGKTDYDVVPSELADKYRRDDQWVHETGKTLRTPEDVVLPTGEKLLLEVIKIPIHDAQGNVIGTQGVFWDQAAWDRRQKELRSATQSPPNLKG